MVLPALSVEVEADLEALHLRRNQVQSNQGNNHDLVVRKSREISKKAARHGVSELRSVLLSIQRQVVDTDPRMATEEQQDMRKSTKPLVPLQPLPADITAACWKSAYGSGADPMDPRLDAEHFLALLESG